jgi:IS30 family transposase
MISPWKCRNPLSKKEREQIKEGIDAGMSYREIGKMLNRNHSVIIRDVKRCGAFGAYDPDTAQKDFEAKQKLVGLNLPSLKERLYSNNILKQAKKMKEHRPSESEVKQTVTDEKRVQSTKKRVQL